MDVSTKLLTLFFIAIICLFCAACVEKGAEEVSCTIERIGQSEEASYVVYTANNGDLYFVDIPDEEGERYLDLLKYNHDNGDIQTVKDNFTSYRDGSNEGFGMIAPTADGNEVYCVTTYGADAEIWKLTCSNDNFEYITSIGSGNNCGSNWWKVFNISLNSSGDTLYFVSINNDWDQKRVFMIDLNKSSPACIEVLNINETIGPERNLCFGGINVWDKYNNFYVPVWSYDFDDNDLALLKVHVPVNVSDSYWAELIHFTDNGQENGNPLLSGFRHHSCWSAIGAASNGCIYMAASNHFQPLDSGDIHGNVAIYKYDPESAVIVLLGDLKTTSTSVDNWMSDESQHKVHTFLLEHADGRIYFASDDYEPSYFLRGAHVYTIDTANDRISDYSKTQPLVLLRDFSVKENESIPSSTSGVFVEYYGIKGLGLNRNMPNLLYVMLYASNEPGHIIKYTF